MSAFLKLTRCEHVFFYPRTYILLVHAAYFCSFHDYIIHLTKIIPLFVSLYLRQYILTILLFSEEICCM